MLGAANQNALFIQQKGLNNFQQSAFNTYVRIIIETEIVGDGEFETLDSKYSLTKSEVKELDEIFKPQFENPLTKIIEWFPISTVDINNNRALLIHYTRVGNTKDKFPVDVKMYKFQNYSRLHTLTISYRIRDKQKWAILLGDILNSFTITNVQKPNVPSSINNSYTSQYSDFDKRRISREKEKGIGKIFLFLLFIPLYTLTRFIKEKIRKKDLDENTISKLKKSIKTAGGVSIAWGIIQVLYALTLITSQGLTNTIIMAAFGLPVIFSGYFLFNNVQESYKSFLVIFFIVLIFVAVIPVLYILLIGKDILYTFPIFNFIFYRFGPSSLTLLLGFFCVSGWISHWILKRDKLKKLQN